MTLRDLGASIVELWQSFLDGLHVAATQSFWDWPLWLSIPAMIGVPVGALTLLSAGFREAREGQPETLGWTAAFGVATGLCTFVTYDLWIGQAIYKDGEAGWLPAAYPIMTAFFGFYFLISVAKRLRRR